MLNLKVIIASTRPGRAGLPIGKWFYEKAKAHPQFETELLDLAEINLPMLDEPHHPRLKQYQHQHTKDWSAKIDSGDAFVIVTPEYNYGYPASLKNALDYVYQEWSHKPVAFVSYGGISGGLRCVQQLKQIVQAYPMIPLLEAVVIPFYAKHMDEQRNFVPTDAHDGSANVLLDELAKWGIWMKRIREEMASSET